MNKYGYYEIDDFMISAPLIKTFESQCARASTKLEKIAACLRIPDAETIKFIKRVHRDRAEEYLQKLNKMNSINRKIYDKINPRFTTTLAEKVEKEGIVTLKDNHPSGPFLNEDDEIIINPGTPNEEKVLVKYTFTHNTKKILLKYPCKKAYDIGTEILVNKKRHKDALQAVTIYKLIESYVNDYYELNHVGEDSAANNNTIGDDILILDSTCNTIGPETLERMTKEEHSKILAIFKKHKVYTSEDLNKIAKRKRPLRALQKSSFHKK